MILGLFILILSWVLWVITASFAGWLVLFLPGAFLVIKGGLRILRDY